MRDIQKEVQVVLRATLKLSENFKLSRYIKENRTKNFCILNFASLAD